MNNLFKAIIMMLPTILLTNCGSLKVTQIAKLNMVSNRNVESTIEYSLLKSYMGASEKEIKKTKAKTLEDAIDETVRNTAGGEFLKNMKVYLVQSKNEMYFAVEGDVWGVKGQEKFRGFSIGDMVQWKDILGKPHKGKITGLKDSKECMIKEEGNENSKAVEYDRIIKLLE
jgi:hypothetical protein